MADISKEMVPIDKHDHPENRLMMWSELELRAIEQYRQAAFKLGRNAGLEEAKGVCLNELNDIHSSNESRNTTEHLADAIESLKDNTP